MSLAFQTIAKTFLVAAVLSLYITSAQILQADDTRETKKTIELTIDYGDGAKRVYDALPWKKDATVLTALESAQKHSHGIKFKFKGKGATAFLTQIDDLKNEGSGSNWIFRVNGELGETSFAIHKLKPGDAVLWKFGKYK